MKLAAAATLSLLAVTACSSHRAPWPNLPATQQVVYYDETFSEGEVDAIKSALSEWNSAVGSYNLFVVGGSVPHSVATELTLGELVTGERGQSVVVAKDDVGLCGEMALACATLGGTAVLVEHARIGNRNLSSIMMHEFGHILGSDHLPLADSLMFPNYNGLACIDDASLKHLATIRRFWRLEEMRATCAPGAAPQRPNVSAPQDSEPSQV